MRISDWSSDVCSSDLVEFLPSALHSPCAIGSPEPIRSFRNCRLTHCYPLVQPVGMSNADGAFLTIGELAKVLNLPQHLLRYWESHFQQLKPMQRSGNRQIGRAQCRESVCQYG